MLWYSLEAPCGGASNEYPQHMFSWRNKKNINCYQLLSRPMYPHILTIQNSLESNIIQYGYLLQSNFNSSNSSNTHGSFTMANSNSVFESLQNSYDNSRKRIFRDFFLILSINCMLCVLIRIASLRQF